MSSRILALAIASMLSVSAMATNQPQGDQHDSHANSSSAAKSNAHANSKSQSTAGAASDSNASATGGAGGHAEQTATGGDASLTSSNTATNSNAVTAHGGDVGDTTTGNQSIAVQEARQTPWVILPSIFANDCGSGVNAGGSKVGGAGAFGFTWTTDKCYDFKNGTNFVAIGAIEEACVLWVDVNRKAFKRQKYTPDCKAIALRVYEGQRVAQTPPPVDAKPDPQYVRRDELLTLLKDRDDRILRQAVSK
jgi:hypothetical protein